MIDPPLFEERDSFLAWLYGMESAFDQLLALTGPEVSSRLNFEVSSLDVLESWLLTRIVDYRELLSRENAALYDVSARYFGEVLRRAVGGDWVPCLEAPRSSNYGYPAIDYAGRGVRIVPHFCITATIDRKMGNYLSSIVRRAQDRR
jgi:hypothetical protein